MNVIHLLAYRVPLASLLLTIILAHILYFFRFPILLDYTRTIKVLIYLAVLYVTGYIVLLHNQITLLRNNITKLNACGKMSPEEFANHVQTTTDAEVAKLVSSKAYRDYVMKKQLLPQEGQSRRRVQPERGIDEENTNDRGSSSSSDSEQEATRLTSHQLATKKKLF